MNFNNLKNFIRQPIHSLPYLKPVQRAAVLSRQELQKIVADMVG